MSLLLHPKFAMCPAPGCSEWEVPVATQAEKEAVEKRHRDRYHPHTAEAVSSLVAADPNHHSEVEAVEQAILVAARRNGGYVTANDVRDLIPSWVLPNVVGATFTRLKAAGRLVPTGDDERSTDTRGRNTNKDCPRYLMREAS